MNGAHLIFCGECKRAVEGVLLSPETNEYRALAPFADDHADRHGHYPDRVHVHEASAPALRRVGRG